MRRWWLLLVCGALGLDLDADGGDDGGSVGGWGPTWHGRLVVFGASWCWRIGAEAVGGGARWVGSGEGRG